jgi:hypothetical protein
LPVIAHILYPLMDSLKGRKQGAEGVAWMDVMSDACVAAKQALDKATLLAPHLL